MFYYIICHKPSKILTPYLVAFLCFLELLFQEEPQAQQTSSPSWISLHIGDELRLYNLISFVKEPIRELCCHYPVTCVYIINHYVYFNARNIYSRNYPFKTFHHFCCIIFHKTTVSCSDKFYSLPPTMKFQWRKHLSISIFRQLFTWSALTKILSISIWKKSMSSNGYIQDTIRKVLARQKAFMRHVLGQWELGFWALATVPNKTISYGWKTYCNVNLLFLTLQRNINLIIIIIFNCNSQNQLTFTFVGSNSPSQSLNLSTAKLLLYPFGNSYCTWGILPSMLWEEQKVFTLL